MGCQQQFALFLLLTLTGLLGCATHSYREAAEKPPLPVYSMQAQVQQDATHSADGYEVVLDFTITSEEPPPWQHIVQEIEHVSTYHYYDGHEERTCVTLVEAFELEIRWQNGLWFATLPKTQRDRHYESGFLQVGRNVASVSVERRVRAYPALVNDADFTQLGFAHLPSNADGSFRTYVPTNFNRTYQNRHVTKGYVRWDDRAGCSCLYQMNYLWQRDGEHGPHADFVLSLPKTARETAAGGVGEAQP